MNYYVKKTDGTYEKCDGEPDLALGRAENKSFEIYNVYVIDVPEEGHWETTAEYPNGGKDVTWISDAPESGHWESYLDEQCSIKNSFEDYEVPKDAVRQGGSVFRDNFSIIVYTPFTEEELAFEDEDKKRREQVQLKVAHDMKMLRDLPLVLQDLNSAVSTIAAVQVQTLRQVHAMSENSAQLSKAQVNAINSIQDASPSPSIVSLDDTLKKIQSRLDKVFKYKLFDTKEAWQNDGD